MMVAVWSGSVEVKEQGAPTLAGTSWRLVQFQGGDGKTVTVADRARYTIDFNADGTLAARIDCNRGRGTWKSSPPQLATYYETQPASVRLERDGETRLAFGVAAASGAKYEGEGVILGRAWRGDGHLVGRPTQVSASLTSPETLHIDP